MHALHGLPEALSAHWAAFASFIVSATRDSTATFEGYMRGLFQSARANMLRMSEVNAVDHQAMPHMLTAGSVDWQGFGQQIAREANELLGGKDAVLIVDESGFAKKGEASAGVARQWNGRLGKVQFLRRARKGKVAGHRLEDLQLPQGDVLQPMPPHLSAGGIPSGPRRRIGSLSSE